MGSVYHTPVTAEQCARCNPDKTIRRRRACGQCGKLAKRVFHAAVENVVRPATDARQVGWGYPAGLSTFSTAAALSIGCPVALLQGGRGQRCLPAHEE